MIRKRYIVIGGLLAAAGVAAAAVAASGPGRHGGGWHHAGFMGGPMGFDGMMPGPAGAARLARLKALDVNKDGAVSLEEMLSPRAETFQRLDRNGDGVIDKAEAEAAVEETVGYWVKRITRRLDTDKDGKITRDEFTRRAREGFAMMDLDGDGRISDSERPHFMRGRGPDGTGAPSGPGDGQRGMGRRGQDGGAAPKGEPGTLERFLSRFDGRFAVFDKNGDGVIDQAEIAAAQKERAAAISTRMLRRFDRDRDGKVTREEFLAPAKERFVELDMNDDGRITDEDLPPMLRGRGLLR
jgi:Ca2+-binding EF-hand superfamily protein